jgi:hypothetical protein
MIPFTTKEIVVDFLQSYAEAKIVNKVYEAIPGETGVAIASRRAAVGVVMQAVESAAAPFDAVFEEGARLRRKSQQLCRLRPEKSWRLSSPRLLRWLN